MDSPAPPPPVHHNVTLLQHASMPLHMSKDGALKLGTQTTHGWAGAGSHRDTASQRSHQALPAPKLALQRSDCRVSLGHTNTAKQGTLTKQGGAGLWGAAPHEHQLQRLCSPLLTGTAPGRRAHAQATQGRKDRTYRTPTANDNHLDTPFRTYPPRPLCRQALLVHVQLTATATTVTRGNSGKTPRLGPNHSPRVSTTPAAEGCQTPSHSASQYCTQSVQSQPQQARHGPGLGAWGEWARQGHRMQPATNPHNNSHTTLWEHVHTAPCTYAHGTGPAEGCCQGTPSSITAMAYQAVQVCRWQHRQPTKGLDLPWNRDTSCRTKV